MGLIWILGSHTIFLFVYVPPYYPYLLWFPLVGDTGSTKAQTQSDSWSSPETLMVEMCGEPQCTWFTLLQTDNWSRSHDLPKKGGGFNGKATVQRLFTGLKKTGERSEQRSRQAASKRVVRSIPVGNKPATDRYVLKHFISQVAANKSQYTDLAWDPVNAGGPWNPEGSCTAKYTLQTDRTAMALVVHSQILQVM